MKFETGLALSSLFRLILIPVPALVLVLAILAILAIFIISEDSCAEPMAVSHLPEEGFSQTILLTDVNGDGPTVVIDFYDEVGKPLSRVKKIIKPSGSIKINIADYLKDLGSIIVNSKTDNVIGKRYHLKSKSKTPIFSLDLTRPQSSAEHVISCPPAYLGVERFILISDVNGSGLEADVKLYDRTGNFLTSLKRAVLPHGTVYIKLNEYLSITSSGKAVVKLSKGGFICEYRQTDRANGKGAAIASLPISNQWLKSHILIDQFFHESHESPSQDHQEHQDKLIITDASENAPAVKVAFYDKNGNQLSQFKKLLQANATIILDQSDYIVSSKASIILVESEHPIVVSLYSMATQLIIPSVKVLSYMGKKQALNWLNSKQNRQNLIYLALTHRGTDIGKVRAKLYSENGTFLKELQLLVKPNELLVQPLEDQLQKEACSIVFYSSSADLIASCFIIEPNSNQMLSAPQAQPVEYLAELQK